MTPTIIKNCTLYNMDCMEAMAGMKDKEYDLAIVDPPYGIGTVSYTHLTLPTKRIV